MTEKNSSDDVSQKTTSTHGMSDQAHQLTIDRIGRYERIITDAQNADDWPTDGLHEVVLDPDEITIEGTPEGIRWLYDWLHWAKRAYRQEEALFDAGECQSLARAIYDAVEQEWTEDLVLNRYRTEFRCPGCGYHGEVFRHE